ncbi:hypothetical protein [Commensalibacter melissae]|nr:hypothetical protein [Commensalibacter melissae]MUG77168.1 hypothetical protein [Commensalibacter melissae]
MILLDRSVPRIRVDSPYRFQIRCPIFRNPVLYPAELRRHYASFTLSL